MEKIVRELIKKKFTGTHFVDRDGYNSDRSVVESVCVDCGCVLTEFHEHDCGSIVMDFEAAHGHFIVVAQGN